MKRWLVNVRTGGRLLRHTMDQSEESSSGDGDGGADHVMNLCHSCTGLAASIMFPTPFICVLHHQQQEPLFRKYVGSVPHLQERWCVTVLHGAPGGAR